MKLEAVVAVGLLQLPPDDSNVVRSLAILLHLEEPKLVGQDVGDSRYIVCR